MKKIILLTALLFQMIFVFGQCEKNQGTELSQNITYLKCENGYRAPKDFEWMVPTKIYVVQEKIALYKYAIVAGNNAEEVNEIWKKGTGNFNNVITGTSLAGGVNEVNYLCLDCGLGYFALVTLTDDFVKNVNDVPNQGLGYTCGQPTIEEAFKIAWKSARDALGKPAKSLLFTIGTNNKLKKLGNTTFLFDYYFGPDINMKTVSGWGSEDYRNGDRYNLLTTWEGRPKIGQLPDDGQQLYNFIIENEYHTAVVFGINNYPIFTEKINSSNKQISSLEKNDKKNSALNNLQKSLNETNPNYNEIKQNLLLYFEKENYPVLSQEQVFSDHGYHNYYFEPTKKFYMREFYVDKMIEVIFPEGFIEMGKEFGNLTKSEISEAATKNYHGKNYHIVSFNLKKN